MYEPVKNFYMGSNPGDAPFAIKVLSALTPLDTAKCITIAQRRAPLRIHTRPVTHLLATGGGWADYGRPGHHDCQPYRPGESQDAGGAGGSEAQIP